MSELRPRNAELDGYVYLPRMLDKARHTLAGTANGYEFGCPLDHTCMARLGITPDVVIDLVTKHPDDQAVLDELRARGIPRPDDIRFDAEVTEDELQAGIYLQVRPRDRLSELERRPGDKVLVVEEGAARICLGDRQQRVVSAGEVVRIPSELPHTIESVGRVALRATTDG
jgi:mannose-6-phosphate isomerase-like protein (cupin superfamily)